MTIHSIQQSVPKFEFLQGISRGGRGQVGALAGRRAAAAAQAEDGGGSGGRGRRRSASDGALQRVEGHLLLRRGAR